MLVFFCYKIALFSGVTLINFFHVHSFNGFHHYSPIQDAQDLLQQAIDEADIGTDSQPDLEPPDTDIQPDLEPPGLQPVAIMSPDGFEIREHDDQDDDQADDQADDQDEDEDVGVRKHLNYTKNYNASYFNCSIVQIL